MKAYVDITQKAELDAVMAADAEPAVIDFWAPWCAPCKAMAPHFEAVAEKFVDAPLSFYKINTEAHPELGAACNVRSLPTTLLVNKGEFADVVVGAVTAERLEKKARWLLTKASGRGFWSRLFG